MGNDGGMIECPELEAAFGSAVLVGRSGALWDFIGIYEEIMGILGDQGIEWYFS